MMIVVIWLLRIVSFLVLMGCFRGFYVGICILVVDILVFVVFCFFWMIRSRLVLVGGVVCKMVVVLVFDR